MSNSKKPTKKEMFTALLNLDSVKTNPDYVEFIEHELDLLNSKNSKPSKKDAERRDHDSVLRSAIVSEMEVDASYTADHLIKSCPTLAVEPELTAAKVSYLMRALLADSSVVSFKGKDRKTYYKLAD